MAEEIKKKIKFGELRPGAIFSLSELGPHLNIKASIEYPENIPLHDRVNAVSLTDGRGRTFSPAELVYTRKV